MLERDYLRRGVAEFVGTFALIFVGAGGAVYARTSIDLALANGLVIAVMVSAFGFISGGHFNPAVTLGFLVTRRIAPALAVVYWVVQFGGAALAALLLKWVLPSGTGDAVEPRRAGARLGHRLRPGRRDRGGADVLPRLGGLRDRGRPARRVQADPGLAIGFTIAFDVLMAYGLTGGAMNPARAFGPQLVGDHWSHFWVWYVGPFAGAVIAASLYELLYLRPPARAPVGPPETGVEEPGAGEAALS